MTHFSSTCVLICVSADILVHVNAPPPSLSPSRSLQVEICSALGLSACQSVKGLNWEFCSSLSFLSTAFSGKHLTPAPFSDAVFGFYSFFCCAGAAEEASRDQKAEFLHLFTARFSSKTPPKQVGVCCVGNFFFFSIHALIKDLPQNYRL